MKTQVICIYHKGCMDGFGAAWVVWKRYLGIRKIEFVAAKYGDEPPPLLVGKDIVIVDFSYPRNVLLEIDKVASSLLVLDHHKTARVNCEGLEFAKFGEDKSGAVMAWEHFFPDARIPIFLEYIQDRDLWYFDLPESRAVNAALASYPMNFETWDRIFFHRMEISSFIQEGQAINRHQQRLIDSLTGGWAIGRVKIAGYDVPCLNCPWWLASEVLNILANGEPFAISYFDDVYYRTFQLRSVEDGVDVGEIAKKFGGGGHEHSAGFRIEKPKIIF